MHNKHVCPEYAGDCKDQFPVFSPVGINKKDLAGMIPVFSTIGRGPRGEGVAVKQLEDGTYQFISTTSGEVVSEVPILDVGSFEVINNTPNPVGGEPISVTIRHTFGGEVKECNLTIPSGEDGASVHTCSALLDKNESNRYSLLLSSFTTTPSVRDSVIFKTVDGEDEFLTFGEVYSVAAKTVGVDALSYLGTGWDSPNIGENGNWWIGSSDTGIPATGPKGDGLPGGGEVGQVMTKTENGPQWVDVSMPDEWPLPINKGGTGASDAAEARGNLDVYSKSEIDERSVRAGFIYVNPSDSLPDGFLWCDGAEHSRTEYPELFAAIGTLYGEGDGSTTFNVPDLQTRVPVGAGDSFELGDTGGEVEHTLTPEEAPEHSHRMSYILGAAGGVAGDGTMLQKGYMGTKYSNVVEEENLWRYTTDVQGGNQPHNNMQPYTVVNYIISTGKGTGVSVADIVSGATVLPLSIEYGGTGSTTATSARKALGITLTNLGAADYIVAEGTSGIWTYRKWASGTAECFCRADFSGLTCTSTWGNMYCTQYMQIDDFPFAFTKTPSVQIDTYGSRDGVAVLSGWGGATRPPSVLFVRPTSVSGTFELACGCRAEGRWK